jgi:hypothetical protein
MSLRPRRAATSAAPAKPIGAPLGLARVCKASAPAKPIGAPLGLGRASKVSMGFHSAAIGASAEEIKETLMKHVPSAYWSSQLMEAVTEAVMLFKGDSFDAQRKSFKYYTDEAADEQVRLVCKRNEFLNSRGVNLGQASEIADFVVKMVKDIGSTAGSRWATASVVNVLTESVVTIGQQKGTVQVTTPLPPVKWPEATYPAANWPTQPAEQQPDSSPFVNAFDHLKNPENNRTPGGQS